MLRVGRKNLITVEFHPKWILCWIHFGWNSTPDYRCRMLERDAPLKHALWAVADEQSVAAAYTP